MHKGINNEDMRRTVKTLSSSHEEITNVRSFTECDYIEAMPVVHYSAF